MKFISTISSKGRLFGRKYISYRAQEPEVFCCEDMKEAWSKGAIGIKDNYDFYDSDTPSVGIFEVSGFTDGLMLKKMPINFCPFCGEGIEVEILN